MNKSQGFHIIAWLEEEAQWTCIDEGEAPAGNEKLFPHESISGTGCQRASAVSILEDFQDLAR